MQITIWNTGLLNFKYYPQSFRKAEKPDDMLLMFLIHNTLMFNLIGFLNSDIYKAKIYRLHIFKNKIITLVLHYSKNICIWKPRVRLATNILIYFNSAGHFYCLNHVFSLPISPDHFLNNEYHLPISVGSRLIVR